VLVLALVASLVPVAAVTGPEAGRALAAAPPAAVRAVADGPLVAAARRDAARLAPRRARAAAPEVTWRPSVASGTANAGRLIAGVQLPASGPGFYTYDPATQRPPGGEDRRWATAGTVREVLALGAWWARSHPGAPRLGVGDLSRPGGGPFPGPGVGHASHQNGLDVDIRLPRRDGAEDRADPSRYDRALTQALVDRLVARGAQLVLIGPSLELSGPAGVVQRWPAHDDHLHVRFHDPDGANN
jgi:murein endopeptidase